MARLAANETRSELFRAFWLGARMPAMACAAAGDAPEISSAAWWRVTAVVLALDFVFGLAFPAIEATLASISESFMAATSSSVSSS